MDNFTILVCFAGMRGSCEVLIYIDLERALAGWDNSSFRVCVFVILLPRFGSQMSYLIDCITYVSIIFTLLHGVI